MSDSGAPVLIAGIGNIFFGDDAFGVEVVKRMLQVPPPSGVAIRDFGIRGLALAYALMEAEGLVILVDALSRGGAPGTLYVLEPEVGVSALGGCGNVDMHGMTPESALGFVEMLGGALRCRLRVVGCEPASFGSFEHPQLALSPVVSAALDGAVTLTLALAREYLTSLRGDREAARLPTRHPQLTLDRRSTR